VERAGAQEPERDQVWRHAGAGGRYVVVGRATMKSAPDDWVEGPGDGPPGGVVVYRPVGSGLPFFARTLQNFLDRFTYEGDG
jgi:hypothetical protein